MQSHNLCFLLAALLALSAGLAAAQEVPAGCACTNNPPDDEYTCDQQKQFGKCESDWMIDQNLCAFTCGLCECEDAPEGASDAAAVIDDTEEEEEEGDADPEEVEDEEEEEEEEEEEPATKKPAPKKPPPKKPAKAPASKPPSKAIPATQDEEETAVEVEEETAVEDDEDVEADEDAEEVDEEDEDEVVDEPEAAAKEVDASGVLLTDFEDADGKCAATVYEALDGSDDTSLFASVLDAAELSTLLSSDKEEYTVFAPTNEAMEDAAVHLGVSLNDLLNLFVEKLATIVKYHIVEGVLDTTDLAKPGLITTLAKSPLIGGSDSEIEGLASSAKISEEVPICSSIVYLVDSVLLPAADLAGIEPKDPPQEIPTEETTPQCVADFDGFFSVSEAEDLTVFTEALNRFALSKSLADPENKYTLFAPTDEAFDKLAVVLDTPLDELLDDEDIMPGILENHILSDVYEGPDLLAQRSLDLKTKNGSTISLETNSQGTLIDLFAKGSSAKVLDTDIDQACEAAVHKISNVLLPFSPESEGTGVRGISVPQTQTPAKSTPAKPKTPSGPCQVGSWSIFEVLNQMSDLSVFTSILSQAGLIPIFTNKNVKVTIFAPVDYAFGNILAPGKGFFDLVPDETLALNLVSNHVVGKIVLEKDFKDGLEVDTALTLRKVPQSLEVEADPLSFPLGYTISSAAATANITRADILACNSVIHVVDAVMIPSKTVIPSKTITPAKALVASRPYGSLLAPTATPTAASPSASG